jgi:cytochrome c553
LKKYYAPSYTDALHKLCVSCHTIRSTELQDKPKLAECATCHESELQQKIGRNLKWKITLQDFNRVILPVIDSVKIRETEIQVNVEN